MFTYLPKVWVAEDLTKRSSVLLLDLVRFSTTQTLNNYALASNVETFHSFFERNEIKWIGFGDFPKAKLF